jgi:hypothetical protein
MQSREELSDLANNAGTIMEVRNEVNQM